MNEPLRTRLPNNVELKLKEKYAESFAGQSDLMDKLAQQLLTLELAIPGLYATVLKLVAGDKATVPVNRMFYLIFSLWLLALLLTLWALLPRAWKVNTEIMQKDPRSKSDELGIKDFFVKSAEFKRNCLVAAAILFFLGIALAALTVT
ncbi:conserved hypothetical protein [Chloroherpeton thalassium ATCC 35110]|uniref:Uncharacterized protein n=1 Tax=Chloroherpeton thalassium (strain ATCC 35110 / GB-78) TaxID=517418 RepID=B3QU51_CHLT3|nr:hypothetical protein [Chloroherpeton thalassium]ACF12849.1 conserved hypothetical protein [Chloroherpeton thalassium ATCC 35110]